MTLPVGGALLTFEETVPSRAVAALAQFGVTVVHGDNGAADCWYKGGRMLHRENGMPAVETPNDDRIWCRWGSLHREGGPAVELSDGSREWYADGSLHRDDGPAIEWPDGASQSWLNGMLRRSDGPAAEWLDGRREWWVNRYLHMRMALPWKRRMVALNGT